MAKVRYDVSGQDPEDSVAGAGEKPKPGVYNGVIQSCDLGYKKGDDGKPLKSDPRLEPIVKIVDKSAKSNEGKDANGALLYDYIPTNNEGVVWKLDQFLLALGIASTKKRKGEFDTDTLKGKKVRIRVKGETYNGEYSAKVGAWLSPSTDGGDDGSDDLGDDEPTDDEPTGGDDEFEDFGDGEEESSGGDDETGHTAESLGALEPKEVAKIAKEEFGIDLKEIPGTGKTKVANAIKAILEAQEDDPFAE